MNTRRRARLLLILGVVMVLTSQAALALTGDITTYVGGVGDGGPATSASLFFPRGVAVDSSGNVFIADTFNRGIRKVTTSGTITTVAGNGTVGFSGDCVPAVSTSVNHPYVIVDVDCDPATSASLNYPYGVAVDSSGNLFIADAYNHRIRKVSTSGTITTVAGNGIAGFSGDGGPASSAGMNYPRGVAVDPSGNLFIADTGNHRIRKVTLELLITTVAGKGTLGFSGDGGPAMSASLYYPHGVAVDSSGNLFIADTGNHRIRKVTLGLLITTVAGNRGWGTFSGDGGPATSAGLNEPRGVAVDSSGNLFIADTENHRIRKVAA